MKQLFSLLGICICYFIVLYFVISFITLSLNPFLWDEGHRSTLVVGSFFLTLFIHVVLKFLKVMHNENPN